MTDMRRISISIPENLENKILQVRKKDEYIRLTYSEFIRRLLFLAVDKSIPDSTCKDTPGIGV